LSSKFRREALLSPDELEELREQLEPVWLAKTVDERGRRIWKYRGALALASHIDLGKKNWILKTKPEYIYYYRRLLGLPRRRSPACEEGGTRYKSGSLREQRLMSLDEFSERLEKIKPTSFHNKRKRAFNILVFYTGLRKGEILMLKRENFSFLEDGTLKIDAFREKKGIKTYINEKAKKEATYSVYLDLSWKYIDELSDWIRKFEKEEKVFSISGVTAWKYVKEIFPDKYPHYYRMNRITYLCNQDLSLAEIQRITGLSLPTIQKYISKGERLAKEAMRKQKF